MAKGGPAPSGRRGRGRCRGWPRRPLPRTMPGAVGGGALSCGHTPSPHGTTESAKVLFSKEWDQILVKSCPGESQITNQSDSRGGNLNLVHSTDRGVTSAWDKLRELLTQSRITCTIHLLSYSRSERKSEIGRENITFS